MVKNYGGKHGKKIARKTANSNNENLFNRKLRLAQGEEELYGIVKKCLGNGQFCIICQDQVERICILRNKFTGRNKQSNMLGIGSWAIIGLRNWETVKPNKKEKCDMLEVYTNNEKHKLLEESKGPSFSFLIQQETILLNIEEDNSANEYLTFSELHEDEVNNISDVTENVDYNNNSSSLENNFEDEIDIDEI